MSEDEPERKPDKYFADQFDDEEVLFVFHKHPIVMRRGFVLGMVAILLGTVPTLIRPELGFGWFFAGIGIGLLLGLLLFSPSWISWYYSVFILTDQRLIQITQKGLFHRSVVDMSLHQIQMVSYQISGIQETMLGFGTILMQTLVGDLVIHEVHHPDRIQKKIQETLRDRGIVAATYQLEDEAPQIEQDEEAEA